MLRRAPPPWRAARRASAHHSTNSPSRRSAAFEIMPLFSKLHFMAHHMFQHTSRVFCSSIFLDFWTRDHTVRALWAHCQKPNAWFLGWEDCADFHLRCDQRWENLHNSRYRLILQQALGVLWSSFLCLTLLWNTSRNSKRARDTSSGFRRRLSTHARPSVRRYRPEALPEEWCAASGSWPSQAGEEC